MPRTEPEQVQPPDATAPAPAPARRRRVAARVRWVVGGLALAAVLLGLGGYRWSLAELARAERELKAGQPAVARARLERLAAMGLGGVEARYWQGVCQEAQGQLDAALATYAAIPPGSARYANAALRRAHLAWER